MAYAARSLAVSAPATWPGAVSILVAAMILVAVGGRLAGQTPPPSTFIDWSADDSARVAFLAAHGRAVRGPGVIFWTPDDSLDRGWVTAFADSLGRAVGRLRSSIGTHLWQRLGDRPVVFYVSPDRFVSHASGRGAVFLSLRSVRERYAPFLHEASHVLLAAAFPFYPVEAGDSLREERAGDRFHFWLSEGLADYLAQRAAGDTGFREGDVFAVGGLARSDSTCAARLDAHPRRDEILARLGRPGWLDALYTAERGEVAPTYYACSQALTRYLVSRIGLEPVISAFSRIRSDPGLGDMTRAAHRPLEGLRRDWLASVGIREER
jgi:hypothetical protein